MAEIKRGPPTPEELKLLLQYDPETGALTWLWRPLVWFSGDLASVAMRRWNRRYAGKPAFTSKRNNGYHQGAVFGHGLLAHRVAWAIYHGSWPPELIDHINGIKTDNRITNLRCVDGFENMKNMKAIKKKADLPPGVYERKGRNRVRKYLAIIRVDGRQRQMGSFKSPEEAHECYLSAAKSHGFSPRHGILPLGDMAIDCKIL